MNSTREQRRSFLKNFKKQLKDGLITTAQYEELKKQISDMGKEQGSTLQQRVLEDKGVSIHSAEDFDLDSELVEDDFTPEDL